MHRTEVMLLGYSVLLSGVHVGYVAWNPNVWPWKARQLKRTFAKHYQLVEYMHRFERRWYELHPVAYRHLTCVRGLRY